MAETKKKGFNLAEALGAAVVPNLGTTVDDREQIEYIDIDRIDDDPNNFYELSALDELAANIELLGLQQPIRVRSNPESIDRVIIVSGHRRRAAIRKLVDDGRADLREIPCIRERSESSEALQELRLIYANSDTRKLTSAEISKQAERVEMLLYQLKEEGYEFLGRMRDHVAEACKVSKSKLSRLKVIREKLIPEYAEYFQKGDLSESSAYRLAKESEKLQRLVWKYSGQNDAEQGTMSSTTEWLIDNVVRRIERIIKRRCKYPDGVCTYCETLLGKVFDSNNYSPCAHFCCAECDRLATCKEACPKMAEKAAKLKLDTKTQRAEERAATQAINQSKAQAVGQLWRRFGEARAASGVSVNACFDSMGIKHAPIRREEYPALEAHEEKITSKTGMPFGFALDLEDIRLLTNLADLLGCSLDYLLCRTDDPAMGGPAATGISAQGGWVPGEHPPELAGECVAVFDMGDGEPYFRAICHFDGEDFRIGHGGAPIKETLVRWMPLPPEPEENGHEDI